MFNFVSDAYKENNILPFQCVYKYFILTKMFSLINRNLNVNDYFSVSLENLVTDHNYATRFAIDKKFLLPLFRKSKCQKSFIFRGIKLWNCLSLSVRTCYDLALFKRSVRKYIVSI